MKADDLLTIDVEAALRKLATATLEGTWQAPAELVRRAVRAGAARVWVRLGRRRVFVRDDGASLAPGLRRRLDVLLDARRPATVRHEALVALEEHPALLAVAALRPVRARIETGREKGTSIDLDVRDLDVEAARRWLRVSTRFAEAEIVVDGASLPRGFAEALVEVPLEPALSGRLAVTPGLDAAQVWLLSAGVVSAHVTLPDAPVFEAAVETAPLAGSPTPAAHREAIAPYLESLADQAAGAMLALADRDLTDEQRRFVRVQLLRTAAKGRRRDDVLRAPLYPVVIGPDAREARRVSLLDLGREVPLPCLEPDADASVFVLPPGPVAVLDAEERSLLARRLGWRFRPVRPRRFRPGLRLYWRRSLVRIRDRIRGATARALHPGLGRPLPESALRAPERALLQALRAALPGAEITLTGGAAAPRRVGGAWRLPRRHPETAAAARLVAREPAWAHAVVLGLLDGGLAPADATVEAWRRRSDPSGGGPSSRRVRRGDGGLPRGHEPGEGL